MEICKKINYKEFDGCEVSTHGNIRNSDNKRVCFYNIFYIVNNKKN